MFQRKQYIDYLDRDFKQPSRQDCLIEFDPENPYSLNRCVRRNCGNCIHMKRDDHHRTGQLYKVNRTQLIQDEYSFESDLEDDEDSEIMIEGENILDSLGAIAKNLNINELQVLFGNKGKSIQEKIGKLKENYEKQIQRKIRNGNELVCERNYTQNLFKQAIRSQQNIPQQHKQERKYLDFRGQNENQVFKMPNLENQIKNKESRIKISKKNKEKNQVEVQESIFSFDNTEDKQNFHIFKTLLQQNPETPKRTANQDKQQNPDFIFQNLMKNVSEQKKQLEKLNDNRDEIPKLLSKKKKNQQKQQNEQGEEEAKEIEQKELKIPSWDNQNQQKNMMPQSQFSSQEEEFLMNQYQDEFNAFNEQFQQEFGLQKNSSVFNQGEEIQQNINTLYDFQQYTVQNQHKKQSQQEEEQKEVVQQQNSKSEEVDNQKEQMCNTEKNSSFSIDKTVMEYSYQEEEDEDDGECQQYEEQKGFQDHQQPQQQQQQQMNHFIKQEIHNSNNDFYNSESSSNTQSCVLEPQISQNNQENNSSQSLTNSESPWGQGATGGCKVVIKNLKPDLEEKMLKDLLTIFGEMNSCSFSQNTNLNTLEASVYFKDSIAAQEVIYNLDQQVFEGRLITVEIVE